MEKIIFNGALYIKKAPSIKLETTLVQGTFNIDDIRTGASYTVEKPEDLYKFSDFVIKLAEDANLIERKEKIIYDNTDFYHICTNSSSFSLISKSLNVIECFATLSELEECYISLEDFIARGLYIGRALTNGNYALELISSFENNYLLRNPIDGRYTAMDKNNPELKDYILGNILPIYYDKETVYQEIINQRLKIGNNGQKR
ncbi:MAG: hypothetical protein HFI49_01170 [Bacilli bacterium]|nr:hypothetical protein [Bacilli bacterium]